jgi:signal transduction histidine kinase
VRLARVYTIVESWALTLWIGALSGFAFIFAPIAFRTIPNLDVFARLVGQVINALSTLSYVCGALALAAILIRTRDASDRTLDLLRAAIILAMLALTVYESRVVVAGMTATARTFGGSISSVPKDDPRRVRYDAQHRHSTQVYGIVLVCGYLTIALSALRFRE